MIGVLQYRLSSPAGRGTRASAATGRCGPELDRPLAPSRGQVVDHVAISYSDLDPLLAHLAAAGIPILEGPYPFGDSRAVLIEDLDGLALELVETGF